MTKTEGIMGSETTVDGHWMRETDIIKTATPNTLTLKLQDPRPGYKLYLPERLFVVGADAESNDHLLVHSSLIFEDIFPGVQAPVHCYGVYELDYSLPT
jgi:hypothetical protein